MDIQKHLKVEGEVLRGKASSKEKKEYEKEEKKEPKAVRLASKKRELAKKMK